MQCLIHFGQKITAILEDIIISQIFPTVNVDLHVCGRRIKIFYLCNTSDAIKMHYI